MTYTYIYQPRWTVWMQILRSSFRFSISGGYYRGFDLSDKQNDRTAVYCSPSPYYYVLFIAWWVIKQVCANCTIWRPFYVWFLSNDSNIRLTNQCLELVTIYYTYGTLYRIFQLHESPREWFSRIHTILPNLRHWPRLCSFL